MGAYPQVANPVSLNVESEFNWRPVPGLWNYKAHIEGDVKRDQGWQVTCVLHPVEGVLVPVRWEGITYGIPRRFLVAAAHLDKPKRVLTETRSGGVAWLYDVARRNGDWRDDSAQNLYWYELPEPRDLDWLMRQRPTPRERQVVSGPKGKPEGK